MAPLARPCGPRGQRGARAPALLAPRPPPTHRRRLRFGRMEHVVNADDPVVRSRPGAHRPLGGTGQAGRLRPPAARGRRCSSSPRPPAFPSGVVTTARSSRSSPRASCSRAHRPRLRPPRRRARGPRSRGPPRRWGAPDRRGSRFRAATASAQRAKGATVRYRRFGRSDLEVSEVGFGVWTLASDWWGVVEDKQGLLRAALDTGINFIDTAPVYGDGGFGEELLADVLKAQRDEIVLTTKCGYDIEAARKFPGQSERPFDWEPASIRLQLEASLQRLGTDHIDLYQLHNTAHRADPQRRAVGGAREVPRRGQGARARRRARSRDRLGRRRTRSAARPRHRVAADGVQRARAGARSHLRGRARSRRRSRRTHLACPARVRHALGSHHARHRVPARRPSLAPQPRQHARQLRQGRDARRSSGRAPAAPSVRPRSPASSPTPRSRPCSPRA